MQLLHVDKGGDSISNKVIAAIKSHHSCLQKEEIEELTQGFPSGYYWPSLMIFVLYGCKKLCTEVEMFANILRRKCQ